MRNDGYNRGCFYFESIPGNIIKNDNVSVFFNLSLIHFLNNKEQATFYFLMESLIAVIIAVKAPPLTPPAATLDKI